MFNQIFEFFVCLYAFFYSTQHIGGAQSIGAQSIGAQNIDDAQNTNNTTICKCEKHLDAAGKTHWYYYDDEVCDCKSCKIQNTEYVPYGGHNICASCKHSLDYGYNMTYAYNGREFCSALCRKRFSDDDLNRSYTMEVRHNMF